MKVYHVFNAVDYVGCFHCRTFSTIDLAETFVIQNLDEWPDLYIQEEVLDDMMKLE